MRYVAWRVNIYEVISADGADRGFDILAAGSRPGSRSAVAGRKVRAPQGRVPGNSWRAQVHGKCHRKYTARSCFGSARVRVKWCGKSAPRGWQQAWQGKPHPEQDQIGERSCGPHGSRVGRLRPAVTHGPDEWLSTTEPGLSAGSLLFFFTQAVLDRGYSRSLVVPGDCCGNKVIYAVSA